MYKLLLCLRYLRTRYIALASVVSVTLGVATMIVVNSVMEGFTHEMQDRIHGILSDVVVESHSLEGFPNPEWHMQKIREVAGDKIAGMTPTVVVPAMLMFQFNGQSITRQISLIGVDEASHAQVSDFGRYLQHPLNRERLSFDLREDGYDTIDHQGGPESPPREEMALGGWQRRRREAQYRRAFEESIVAQRQAVDKQLQADRHLIPGNVIENDEAAADQAANPFDDPSGAPVAQFDPEKEQWTGLVVGYALSAFRRHDGIDRYMMLPGDDVKIMLPTTGSPPKVVSDLFTVVDFYESKMSEYDAMFVFVPIEKLQQMRNMIDPSSGMTYVTSIQIRLHDDADGPAVREKLKAIFPAGFIGVQTWRDKQGPLLAAVQMETAILNVLLFMIIAVAGFGILAIFYMIVVEKTRDIGILKSLGAPSGGIMGIFLTYGLSLGIVGSGAGMVIGLLFVANINTIADALAWVTGQQVFDPAIYYFQKIPTIVVPFTVSWIVAGAVLIAVVASILPARRAARLHPVEALRYE